MPYLFLNTTNGVDCGLLDHEGSWIQFKSISTKKGSKVLHREINDLLDENQLKITQVEGLVMAAGPGSYTGMRLSQGLADLFKIHQINVFGFYLFEVPLLAGFAQGKFLCNAFKGESFLYEWDSSGKEHKLMGQSKLEQLDFSQENLFHPEGPFQGHDLYSVSQLMHQKSKVIFSQILKAPRECSPFYFRPSDKEFRPSFTPGPLPK